MIRLKRYVLVLAALILTVFGLIMGKTVFTPLVYAMILFLLLLPVHQRWLNWMKNRFVAVVMGRCLVF